MSGGGGEGVVLATQYNESRVLRAEIERLRRERDEAQARADNHWQTLRSIREMAREGDCDRIIQWVTDAGSGYVETNEATLKATIDRATAAEAQVAALQEALERAKDDLLDLVESDQHLAPAIERIDASLAQPKEGPAE